MANLLLGQVKKQTSSFLHNKLNNARLVFTDVTRAELLAEEATNDQPCSPDAKTMTILADASLDIDDFWRIADVLHSRLNNVDWKKWRHSYKALVLLEFLLTHGHEDFAVEFICKIDVIEELGTFQHKDEKGFDWGLNMQKKSKRIIELLQGGDTLKQARLKALKISNEIQGFGNMVPSSSSSSDSSGTSNSSGTSSFASTTTSAWSEVDEQCISELPPQSKQINETFPKRTSEDCRSLANTNKKEIAVDERHGWECHSIEENGCLLGTREDDDDNNDETSNYDDRKSSGFLGGLRAKLASISPSKGDGKKFGFRSISDAGKAKVKEMNRQHSLGN